MRLRVDEKIGHVGDILSEKQKNRGVLIQVLHEIQKEHNYLPEDALRKISEVLQIPLSEVYSTASFYKQFYFNPRGKNIVRVCTGTACHVRGAPRVIERLKDAFNIKEGETTPDLSMTLETVGCIGCCGLAPVATINEEVVGEVDAGKIEEIINMVRGSKAD